MGLFLCLGQPLHEVVEHPNKAISFESLPNGFVTIHQIMETTGKAFIFFAQSSHKIKKKAEQVTCEMAIKMIMSPK